MGTMEESRQWRMHRLLYGSAVSRRAGKSRLKISARARTSGDQPLRPGVRCRILSQKIRRIKKLLEVRHSRDLLDEVSQAGSDESCHRRAHAADAYYRPA